MNKPLLEVQDLVTTFSTSSGTLTAVNRISFSIESGKTLGLVGESGCGKSVTSLSILRLIDSPPGNIESGRIYLNGVDLLTLTEGEIRQVRGNEVSMIFQEPMTSLNPVFPIGDQIGEVFRLHQRCSKKEARQQSIEMLDLVKIPSPHKRVDDYPHQLSGGMRQRVMIAMALACEPRLLIADEPTTALDVTVQAQILDLMGDLQDRLGMAILFITHDLGVVAEACDDVIVMYAGSIVERGTVRDIFENSQHPYTAGLLNSIPRLGSRSQRLPTIPGHVPSLRDLPSGCAFRNRCDRSMNQCAELVPPEIRVDAAHSAACFLLGGE